MPEFVREPRLLGPIGHRDIVDVAVDVEDFHAVEHDSLSKRRSMACTRLPQRTIRLRSSSRQTATASRDLRAQRPPF